MKKIKFTVYGEPKGKARPKFARIGNHVRTYTTEQTVNYENFIRYSFAEQINNIKDRSVELSDTAKYEGMVRINLTILYGVPSSTSKKRSAMMMEGLIRPTKKPDADNVLKAVLDGLNGYAFKDDKQVVDIGVYKYYSDVPRLEIEIQYLEELHHNLAITNE